MAETGSSIRLIIVMDCCQRTTKARPADTTPIIKSYPPRNQSTQHRGSTDTSYMNTIPATCPHSCRRSNSSLVASTARLTQRAYRGDITYIASGNTRVVPVIDSASLLPTRTARLSIRHSRQPQSGHPVARRCLAEEHPWDPAANARVVPHTYRIRQMHLGFVFADESKICVVHKQRP